MFMALRNKISCYLMVEIGSSSLNASYKENGRSNYL